MCKTRTWSITPTDWEKINDVSVLRNINRVASAGNFVELSNVISDPLIFTMGGIYSNNGVIDKTNQARAHTPQFILGGSVIEVNPSYLIYKRYKYDTSGTYISDDSINSNSCLIPQDGYIYRISLKKVDSSNFVESELATIAKSVTLKEQATVNGVSMVRDAICREIGMVKEIKTIPFCKLLNNTVIATGAWYLYYAPIKQGQTYKIKIVSTVEHTYSVAFSANEPQIGASVSDLREARGTDIEQIFTAQQDGYLCWDIHQADLLYGRFLDTEFNQDTIINEAIKDLKPIVINRIENYAINGSATDNPGKISANNGWNVQYVKVNKGDIVQVFIEYSTTHQGRIGFTQITPAPNIVLNNLTECLANSVMPELLVAPNDGFICWQVKDGDLSSYKVFVNAERDFNVNKFEKLRFAQWNMAHFNMGPGITNRIQTEEEYNYYLPIYRGIYNKLNADFINLCEFESPFYAGHAAYTTKRELFPQYKYYKDNATSANGMWVAFFSHLPLANIKEVEYDSHPEGAYRYYFVGDMIIGNKVVKVVCTHLTHSDTYAPLQIQQLITDFANEPYVVMLADWNSRATGFQPLKDAGYSMANHDYMGTLRTYYSPDIFDGAMDNIVVKGGYITNINVMNTNEIAGSTLSDHYIIYCDINF